VFSAWEKGQSSGLITDQFVLTQYAAGRVRISLKQ
jgi:hypothetical protein